MKLASVFATACLMLLSITSNAQPQHSTFATISTSEGNIKLELFAEKAPVTVKNFVDYANEHFFEGTIFHRVIPGFMIQGGGFTPDMARKATKAPIHNEADNGLHNNRGTIAMARTNDPNSATSQFFINVENNNPLDFSLTNPGYAVFGKVVSGMDIVDKIAATSTGRSGYFNDVPLKPIIINNVTIE